MQKCGNMWNTWQSHIRIKLTCLESGQETRCIGDRKTCFKESMCLTCTRKFHHSCVTDRHEVTVLIAVWQIQKDDVCPTCTRNFHWLPTWTPGIGPKWLAATSVHTLERPTHAMPWQQTFQQSHVCRTTHLHQSAQLISSSKTKTPFHEICLDCKNVSLRAHRRAAKNITIPVPSTGWKKEQKWVTHGRYYNVTPLISVATLPCESHK